MNKSSLVATLIHDTDRMSSLEIAELTGKQHSNVMRDIRNIIEQLADRHKFNFELMFKITKLGNRAQRKDPYYQLTKKDCLLLASGYDANLRAKIINRWEELELKQLNCGFKIPQSFSEALQLAANQAKQIEQLQPKAELADKIIATPDKVFKKNTILFAGLKNLCIFAESTDDDCIRYAGQAVKLLISYMGIFYALIGYRRLPLRKIIVFALVANMPSVDSVKCNRFLFDKVAIYNFL